MAISDAKVSLSATERVPESHEVVHSLPLLSHGQPARPRHCTVSVRSAISPALNISPFFPCSPLFLSFPCTQLYRAVSPSTSFDAVKIHHRVLTDKRHFISPKHNLDTSAGQLHFSLRLIELALRPHTLWIRIWCMCKAAPHFPESPLSRNWNGSSGNIPVVGSLGPAPA